MLSSILLLALFEAQDLTEDKGGKARTHRRALQIFKNGENKR